MKGFFDSFFVMVATCMAGFALADWLIGPKGRKRMRERVGDWWLFLQYSTWKELAAEDARRVAGWLTRFFGQRFFSWQFIWRSAAVSFTIQTVSLVGLSYWLKNNGNDHLFSHLTNPLVLGYYVGFAGIAALLDWLTIVATILILRRMSQAHSGYAIIGFVVLDIVVALLLFACVFYLGVWLYRPEGNDPSWIEKMVMAIALGTTTLPAAITAMWPTLLHLLVCAVFLGSKLTEPVAKKPISLALLRFHESDKGVLTGFAVGLGAVTKLIQEWVKYLNAT
jgi:hypothetical protein